MGSDESRPQKPKHLQQTQRQEFVSPFPDLNQEDLQKKIIPQAVELGSKPCCLKGGQKPIKIKKTKAKYKQKVAHQNSIKLKKVQQITTARNTPSEIFFSDHITSISRSRLDLFLEPFKGEPLKPVVEYDAKKRGAILLEQKRRINDWNKLITCQDNISREEVKMIGSFIAINAKPTTEFKLRQIKKRLNDLTIGQLESRIDECMFEECLLTNV